jgi:hypothetical protein
VIPELRCHAGTAILVLAKDLPIRVLNAATGGQLRELTLDTSRNYQPTGAPKGPDPAPSHNTGPRTLMRV